MLWSTATPTLTYALESGGVAVAGSVLFFGLRAAHETFMEQMKGCQLMSF